MKSFKLFHEMSINVGNKKLDISTEHDQKHTFNTSHHYPIDSDLGNNLKKHIKKQGNVTKYYINDHNSGKTLYKSEFHEHNPTTLLPFKHQEQTSVERTNTKLLPKDYALHETLNHVNKTKLPIISSTYQTPSGHHMWKKMVAAAFVNGHHIYYHDGERLHKSNAENMNSHLNSYYDPGTNYDANGKLINPLDYEHKHMIISREKL